MSSTEFRNLILDLIEKKKVLKDKNSYVDSLQTRKVYNLTYSFVDFTALRLSERLKLMVEAKSREEFIKGFGYKFTKVELAKLTNALLKMGTYAKLDASK